MDQIADSSAPRVQGDWMTIWKLKIPQKIKLLLWRAARGCLPTRCVIFSINMLLVRDIVLCVKAIRKNERHIFFDLVHAEFVWTASGLLQQVKIAMAFVESFRECFFSLLQSLGKPSRKTMAMMFWALWKQRNNKAWEGVSEPVNLAVSKVMNLLFDWIAARSRGTTQRTEISAYNPRFKGGKNLLVIRTYVTSM